MKNAIIIISVGDKDYFKKNDFFNKKRNYDILINYYGSENIERINYFKKNADYFTRHKYTWLLNFYYVIKNNEFIKKYKYICKMDDDIVINYTKLNHLFNITNEQNATISQPSFLDFNLTYKCFKNKENSIFRNTRFIETQFPVFESNFLLNDVLPVIEDYLFNFKFQSGWAIDVIWSEIIGKDKKKIIVDNVSAKHMNKTNTGKNSYYYKNNINPFKEASIFCKKYGIDGRLNKNGYWENENYFKKLHSYTP